MECFTNVGILQDPHTSLACPLECHSKYYTSCESAAQCSICTDHLCNACIGNFCIQCTKGSYADQAGTCRCMPNHVFLQDETICEPCHESCLDCTIPFEPSKCSTCKPPLVKFNPGNSNSNEGQCLEICPINYKRNPDGICTMQCHKLCKTCSEGVIENKCISCIDGYYLVGQKEGPCVRQCPFNTTSSSDGKKCLPCHPNCLTCLSPYDNTTCIKCNPATPIKTNTGPHTSGTCTKSCHSTSFYLDTIELVCYPNGKCPVTKYKNITKRECQPCDISCFGCTQSNNSTKCKGCSNQTNYLRILDKIATTGSCVSYCQANDEVDKVHKLCYPKHVLPSHKKTIEKLALGLNIGL